MKNSSSVELEKNLVTHKALFALLANLALSPECRGVLWKVLQAGFSVLVKLTKVLKRNVFHRKIIIIVKIVLNYACVYVVLNK